MNFHWELRKGSIRWKLRTWAGQRVRVVEVQRHELRVERLPERGRCRIRYYPAVGRMFISGPAGQYIGWANTLAEALYKRSIADTSQVLPENGLLNERRPIK